MSNSWDHEQFKAYVLNIAANSGVDKTADLARKSGIKPGMISKWFRGVEQPSVGSLQRLAGSLNAPLVDLLVLAGRAGRDELSLDAAPSVPDVVGHPLAREIHKMLADDSPIPPEDRTVLETVIDRVIEPYRKTMRRRRAA